MAIRIDRWNPEFSPEELETLYSFLDDEGELPEDDQYFILTKKEFMELDIYTDENYLCPENEDDVEQLAYFASMLERIRGLVDSDVLEIDLSNV